MYLVSSKTWRVLTDWDSCPILVLTHGILIGEVQVTLEKGPVISVHWLIMFLYFFLIFHKMIFQSLNYAFEYFKWYIFSLTSPRGTKLVVQHFYFLIWHAVNTFHCHRTDGHPEHPQTICYRNCRNWVAIYGYSTVSYSLQHQESAN